MAEVELTQDQPISEVNEPAPGFRLPSTEGSEVGLEDFRGQPVLLFFYRGAW